MSIRQYFKPRDSLPDPKGPLCNSVASNAIAMANKEVEKEIAKKKKKRGQYRRCEISQLISIALCSRKLKNYSTDI